MSKRYLPLLERFESKYIPEPNTGCWLWIGCCSKRGYGRLTVNKEHLEAHRVSWKLANGTIPAGLYVLHHCDTPCCVNPAHLFLGTQADNMADKVAKGRQAKGDRIRSRLHPEMFRGERNPEAKLTDAKAREILSKYGQVGVTQTSLAAEYGVHQSSISHIVNRKNWRHIEVPLADKADNTKSHVDE